MHESWLKLSDEALNLLLELMAAAYKGQSIVRDIDAVEASDILNEFLLVKMPFKVVLRSDKRGYYLKILPEVKRKGWFLYKYYLGNELVYLGRTNRPSKRYMEHCRENPKFKYISRIGIFQCRSKADMIFLERVLISKYRPPWNTIDTDNGELSYDVDVAFEDMMPIEVIRGYE